jgi:amino acid permease
MIESAIESIGILSFIGAIVFVFILLLLAGYGISILIREFGWKGALLIILFMFIASTIFIWMSSSLANLIYWIGIK